MYQNAFDSQLEFIEYKNKAYCSNHVINFKIVESAADLLTDEKPFFRPKFTHQLFNLDETVRGHDKPSIEVFLSAGSLRPYLQWSTQCAEKLDLEPLPAPLTPSSARLQASMRAAVGVTAASHQQMQRKCRHTHKQDDIQGVMLEQFGVNSMYLDRALFVRHLKEEAQGFKPPGKVIHQFTREVRVKEKEMESLFPNAFFTQPIIPVPPKQQDTHQKKTFKVYKVQVVKGNFKDNNRHLQALLKFYIEGASFIIVDALWFYFLVYMDSKLVAFATAYEEFHKVPKAAATISQVLVLPPYQGMGVGSKLLDILYVHYLKDKKCQLITVEDPALDFQRIKDCLDTKLILQAGFFQQIKKALFHQVKRSIRKKRPYLSSESLRECTLDHIEIGQIKTKLKLAKINVQRCFEFVLMALLDPKDHAAHDSYRKSVLKRMAESRDLLRPYFIYDEFADRSLYCATGAVGPSPDMLWRQRQQQWTAMLENRCMADGLLGCLAEQNQDVEMKENDGKSKPIQKEKATDNKDSSKVDAGRNVASRGSTTAAKIDQVHAPKLRPNRFTATPLNEQQSPAQVTFELPTSLAIKVTQAIREYWLCPGV